MLLTNLLRGQLFITPSDWILQCVTECDYDYWFPIVTSRKMLMRDIPFQYDFGMKAKFRSGTCSICSNYKIRKLFQSAVDMRNRETMYCNLKSHAVIFIPSHSEKKYLSGVEHIQYYLAAKLSSLCWNYQQILTSNVTSFSLVLSLNETVLSPRT